MLPHTAPPAIVATSPAHALSAGPAEDWSVLTATRANALVIGDERAILRLWTRLWPALQKPVAWSEAGKLALPPQESGTLILQRVDLLNADDQRRVADWVAEHGQSVRLLATSARAISSDVERGTFLDDLYAHLTAVLTVDPAAFPVS